MGRWGYSKGPRVRDASGHKILPEIVPTPDEEWRLVPGWEEFFSVSSCGRVRTEPEGKILAQSYRGQDGYLGINLIRGDRRYSPLTATIVAHAFLGPKPKGAQIDHKDGNKLNNFASNLEYVSHRVNHKRAADMELHAWGERHGASKLTDEKVRRIRELAGTKTDKAIAAEFGVTKSTILSIRRGFTWHHLTDENSSLATSFHAICCTCCTELAALKAARSPDPDSGYRPVLHSDNCLIIVEQDDPQGYQPTTDLACTCGADPSRSPDRTSADRRQGTLVPNMRQRDTAEKQS